MKDSYIVFFILVLILYCSYNNTIKEDFSVNIFDSFKSKKIYSKNSMYQQIDVYDFEKNKYNIDRCLVLDDELQLCQSHEKKYHEFMTHFPSYYLNQIKNVLIIGGGDCMNLREVMKYKSIKQVDMLELDPDVIKVSKKFFNQSTFKKDNRVNIILGDAYGNIIKQKNNFYDLILIDLTEDNTNNSPLDTTDFYKLCKTKLKKDGIIVKNGNSLENYLRLKDIFTHVDIYTSQLIIFPNSIYKFIICSNNINFKKAKIKNECLKNNRVKLNEYAVNKHNSYFFTL